MNRLAKLMCALAAMAVGMAAYGSAPILLKAKTIVPDAASGSGKKRLTLTAGKPAEAIPERGLYLIQHEESANYIEWREQLEATGAIIRSYMPENAYMIEAGPAAYSKIISGISYSYFAPFETAWKIHATSEAANSRLATTSSSSVGGQPARRHYSILIFEETTLVDVVAEIEKLTGQAVRKSEGCMIWAMLTAEEVKAVAASPDVHSVSLYVAPRTCNDVAVQAPRMNVETVWPNGATGLNLTGAGQVIAVADTGLDTGDKSTVHNDVRGRILSAYSVGRKNVNGKWDDLEGHGTHVVGSVLGNGSESSHKIRGTAYEASLVMQSTGQDPSEWEWNPQMQKYDRFVTTGDMYILLNQAYTNQNGKTGARIHSDSWGGKYMGKYMDNENRLDKFMFEHPDMLVVVAAGNNAVDANKDGVADLDSLNSPSSAKNCLTVGATENHRTIGGDSQGTWYWYGFDYDPIRSDYISRPSDGVHQGIAAFSSRGPCDDGRIKPDIVAPGTDILSMSSSVGFEDYWGSSPKEYDNFYRYMGGTSMACPLVSGSAALCRQWLQEKRGIANPDGATIKALLLAGAKSLAPGQYGTSKKYQEIPDTYPNNVEGWGQVNMGNTVANSAGVIVSNAMVIAAGDNAHSYRVYANKGQPMSIVMAYTDAPSSANSVGGLQNDLDMVVTTPSNNTLYPNSRTSPDNINNVEGVRLAASEVETGFYTIKISVAKIKTPMASSLTGGKANATRYSLVVNGATEDNTPPEPVKKPDLAFVTYGDWPASAFLSSSNNSSSRTDSFEEGAPIYLFAYFRNVGTADSVGFTVRHKVVNASNNSVVGSVDNETAAKAVGQGGGWNGTAVPILQGLPAGTYKWICKLDADSVVGESSEDNNEAMVPFTVTKKAVPIPGAPGSLTVSTSGNNLMVAWNAVSGAVSYKVYRAETSSKPGSEHTIVSGAASYLDQGVEVGKTYYYWVSAVNSEGKEGTASGPKSGKVGVELSFTDSSVRTFDYNGGQGNAVVSANASWNASVDKSWVHFTSATSGGSGKTTLAFSVDALNEQGDRTATITVAATDGSTQKKLSISQTGKPVNPALAAALDSNLAFMTGGASDWVEETTEDKFSTAGSYVRSGTLSKGQSGWIETTVTGSGTLQFRYSLSAMYGGTFVLIVDGSEVATLTTAAGAWKYCSHTIASTGSHKIRWEYRQNFGSSYAMLDDVSFGSGNRPRLPDMYSVTSADATGVSIFWQVSFTSVTECKIYRATSLSAMTPELIKTVTPSGDSYFDEKDTTGAIGVTYYYWVEAINSYGSTICEGKPGQKESGIVVFDANEIYFPPIIDLSGYGATNIKYTANMDFYARSNVDWITIQRGQFFASSKSMNLQISANVEPKQRYGIITLSSDPAGEDVVGMLTIVQEGMERNPSPLTWYVDATNGDDANEGSTWETAKKSIQAAVDSALSGDEIVVGDGTYQGFMVNKLDLRIRSLNGAYRTIVDGAGLKDVVVDVYDTSSVFTGFMVQNNRYNFSAGGCVRRGSWHRSIIRNGSARRGGGAFAAKLYNCLVSENVADDGAGGTTGCDLYNCIVTRNGSSTGIGGVAIGSEGVAYNCIIWGNTNKLGEVSNWSGSKYDYCCTYPRPETGVGNISDDPLLTVADGVCSLDAASPCLNAGNNDYAVGEFDLVGNPRIGNGVVDIGAVEDITVAPDSPSASVQTAQMGSIKIDIQPTSRAVEYVVYRSTASSPCPEQSHAMVKATPHAVTVYTDTDDVLPGVEYWYWVVATNEAGPSVASSAGKGYQIPNLGLNPDAFSQFAADGGYAEVGVTADSDWAAISSKDWALVTPSAGNGNGVLAVTVASNTKTEQRDAVLSVVAGFGTAHPVTNSISVMQAAAPPPVYHAVFDMNGGQGDMAALDFPEGSEQALSPCGFTRTGYAFAGWSLEPDGEAFYTDGQVVTLQKDTTLYAVWVPNTYTVIFHSNDGTRKSVSQEFVYDVAQALTGNSFAVVGGEFSGWATDANGGVVYEDGQSVLNLTAEAEGIVSLYAVWRALPVAAPTLDALTASESIVSISITPSENGKAYRIYRATVNNLQNAVMQDEIPADGSSPQTLQDMSAEPGVEYHYWVSAVGIGNNESDKTYCGLAYRQVGLSTSAADDTITLMTIGEEKSVPVWANAGWKIESKDGEWFEAEKAVERNDDREQEVLKIKAKSASAIRTGSVVLVAGYETAHPARKTITVSQPTGLVPEYGPWGDEPLVIRDNVSPVLYDDVVVTFDGEAMLEGDVVALYDQNDRLRAVGKVVLYNGGLTLSVSMNVSAGTKLRIVAWRHGTDYDDLLNVPKPVVVPDDVSFIEDTQYWNATHSQSLELLLKTPGWNQISFNVLPDDASPESVFGEVADKISSVIDGNRNYLNWRPGKGGTLEEIVVGAGYWVFAKEAPVSWTVTGMGDPSVEIKLTAGWNMIGYPLPEERPIAEALRTAIEGNLIKTIVGDGNWPKGTLTTLSPGNGYWFYVPQACTITFDDN